MSLYFFNLMWKIFTCKVKSKLQVTSKLEMEAQLWKILKNDYYNIKELIDILGLKEKQANRAFRKLLRTDGINREEVIFRLMGGSFYL